MDDSDPKDAEWRFGTVRIRSDMLDVRETGDRLNYGFKLDDPLAGHKPKIEVKEENEDSKENEGAEPYPDDAFPMATQFHDVVWNGNIIENKVLQKHSSKTNAAGWIPSTGNRTEQAVTQPEKVDPAPVRRLPPLLNSPLPGVIQEAPLIKQEPDQEQGDTCYSIFPVENEGLIFGRWKDDVIYDADNIKTIPKPSILTLDPNDENIILGIPNDIDPSKQISDQATPVKVKHEDIPPPPSKSPDRDHFNISNDIYDQPTTSETSPRSKIDSGNLIQHSIPVVELRPPFIQTHMGPMKLRNFHRPPMERFSHESLTAPGPHSVMPLLKHMKKKNKHAEEIKRRSLMLKDSRDTLEKKRRREASNSHRCHCMKKYNRKAKRLQTDPVVLLSAILENILNEMREMPHVKAFLFPVNPKHDVDYYRFVHQPMDLQTIRENLKRRKYRSREEFLADVKQIVKNSSLYYESDSSDTAAVERMLHHCLKRLGDREKRLTKLETAINSLPDDKDQVALSFILDYVLNIKLKTMSESWPFLKPVNKLFKDYYNIVKTPMDLETLNKNITAHKYQNRHEFLRDIEQILENCILYNGKHSYFTKKARVLVKACKHSLNEFAKQLSELEINLMLARVRAMQDDDQTSIESDDENYTIAEPNRTSSTDHLSSVKSQLDEFDLIDLEGEDIPMTDDTLKLKIKIKRKGKVEQAHTLEEDLRLSIEKELNEVPLNEFEDDQRGILISAEMPIKEEVPHSDSEQAEEAMVELSTMGYYPSNKDKTEPLAYEEENMDVDSNYDPSDFLMSIPSFHKVLESTHQLTQEIPNAKNTHAGMKNHELALSESDDETSDPDSNNEEDRASSEDDTSDDEISSQSDEESSDESGNE